MNKTVKRALALMLAMLMLVTVFAACGNDSGNSSGSSSEESSQSSEASNSSTEESSDVGGEDEEPTDTGWTIPSIDSDDYDEISDYYYEFNLSEFHELCEAYAAEIEDQNRRWALEALAEAKLMASGVMQPTRCNGGQYQISAVAPGSVTSNGWGSDDSRYQYALITDKVLKTEDRDALKKLLNEKRGTGEYRAAATEYLTSHGYQLKDSLNLAFGEMPTTYDMVNTSRAGDATYSIGSVDSLLYYDGEDRELPALAESYDVSEDGLTYTFHIRKGVKWVDSQGREVGDVIADDWVAGMQHMLDSQAGLETLFIGYVVGVGDYVDGKCDIDGVGIKAIDDYTLEYTLEKKTPYFTSMLHYGISLPLSRSYYTSQGGKFGDDFDDADENYMYGRDPDHIAYCGPFLITNVTENNSITYKANPLYWDAENVTIKSMSYLFNDGSDPTKGYNDVKARTIDNYGINSSTLVMAKEEKMDGDEKSVFDTYVYVSATGSASYFNFLNINRAAWANSNNAADAVSKQTDEQKEVTHAAMNNVHFRRALACSVDRVTWNAQNVGDDIAELCLRNTYTPATFVTLSEDVTVPVNGVDTTFPAGTDYGKIMQAQLDADGVKITVYKDDPNAENGRGTGDGFDGWFNVEYAQSELEIALEELAANGITVDESNPVHLDFVYPSQSPTRTNAVNAFKQQVEKNLGGKVIIDLVDCPDNKVWYATGYNIERGYEANYDLFDLSGWSPDYQDPCSYVDTFLPNYNGYMTKCIGIY
ncbi:ABC transporter substrate-binding protein [Acutalibacter sp. 1XD8-36]|uniref:ABC transporter substrate-binding protein n=1 Tax=Acutalibacter sp. 1XD8-36 TaxID=2320852 RepID=UPI00262FC3BF|nr:ABC transporter substrate-binding protein [Acutalibacter sp. 1XD8-36]